MHCLLFSRKQLTSKMIGVKDTLEAYKYQTVLPLKLNLFLNVFILKEQDNFSTGLIHTMILVQIA